MNETTERELSKVLGFDVARDKWPKDVAERFLVREMASAAATYRARTRTTNEEKKLTFPHLVDWTGIKVSAAQKKLWTYCCDGTVSGTKIYQVRPGLYVVCK